MKQFSIFTIVIAFFSILIIFMAERTDILNVNAERVEPSFSEKNGQLTFSWRPFKYPCYYRVDTLSRTTGLVPGEPKYHLFSSEFTHESSYKTPPAAIPVYYRVSAYGLFFYSFLGIRAMQIQIFEIHQCR